MDILRSFHLHMISDATGETLITIAKAVRVQYAQVRAIEHLHPLVRSRRELERVVKDVEAAPGIVLYTLFNRELADELEKSCKRLNIPCVPALKPILQVFESYLGTPSTPTIAGQHVLDADYFRRIEALNFTMLHDDGHLPENLNEADMVLVGISRTSKTPTSIYLANRGFKTANFPLVPGGDAAAAAGSAGQCLRGRTGGKRGPHRPSPPEPRDRARPSSPGRLCRPRDDCRRDRPDAGALRAARLADHRRDPPLDRRDRGGDHPPLPRPRSAGAGGMSSFLQSGRPPLILASGSKSRARVLEAAGLAFIVEPPGLDEAAMRQAVERRGVAEPA